MTSFTKLFTEVPEEISLRNKNQYLGSHLQLSFSSPFYPSSLMQHLPSSPAVHPPSVC